MAEIESRVITGDNIYIAIETAIRCHILNRDEQIVVVEGHEQTELQGDETHMQFVPS